MAIKAVMKSDDYIDLVPGYEYNVSKILYHRHVMLEGSPRRYDIGCFYFIHNGKKISKEEAYRQYALERVKKKLGVKY